MLSVAFHQASQYRFSWKLIDIILARIRILSNKIMGRAGALTTQPMEAEVEGAITEPGSENGVIVLRAHAI